MMPVADVLLASASGPAASSSSFFFQAEASIRDKLVTGVQTCALPIYPADRRLEPLRELPGARKTGKSWKDEVRERVRDRRRQRSGDLPLFSDVEPPAEGADDAKDRKSVV